MASSVWALIFQCFSVIFTTKSHPLKKYRDGLVGREGVQILDSTLIPNGTNGRRLLLIGDVHGCLEELRKLLKKCDFDAKKDHVIFVGDLVAKGPFSLETISFVDDLGSTASCVRGNHDDKLMQWKAYLTEKSDSGDLVDSRLPDGLSRRDEHRFLAKNLDVHQVEYLESLPYIVRIPMHAKEYLVVHAGLLPKIPLHKQKCWDVTNMRNIYKKEAVDNREEGAGWFKKWEDAQMRLPKSKQKTIIYGHDAGRDLNLRQFSKGLDSRCVRGGKLTAMIITGDGAKETYEHVTAKRQYD